MGITGRLLRTLWLVVATVIILYAVVVVSAREMLPLVNRFQPGINDWLSARTGTEVNIGRLSGLWRGFTPTVDLEAVTIAGTRGETDAIYLDQVSAELHPLKSLVSASPVWRSLTAGVIRLNMVEDRQGNWTLAGHPLGSGGDSDLDFLFRMLSYSRLLRIENLEMDVSFYSGSRARIIARDIVIENDAGFHRATARVALDEWGTGEGDGESAYFVFEGRGDLLDSDDFTGRGYLAVNQLNIEGSLGILAKGLFPRLTEKIGKSETDLELDLWFDWIDNAAVNGRGRIKAAVIPLDWVTEAPPIRNLEGDITAWFTPGEDWGFRMQNLSGSWGNEPFKPLDFRLRQGVGARWGKLDVAVNHLNLATVSDLLLKGELVPEKFSNVLAELQPTGTASRISADFDFTGERPGFLVRARVDNGGVSAWHGAPAARGVTGYVEAGPESGFLVLDCPENLAIHFHQAYDDFMPFSCPRGKVAWRWLPDQDRVSVSSDVISVEGDEGRAAGVFHLELPTRSDAFEPEMYLMVGARQSHSRYLDRYLPNVLDPDLDDWLHRAVGPGQVPELGFIWRGSLIKSNGDGRSIQLFAGIEGGTLDYQEGWPPLTGLSALLVVDNRRMDAWLDNATAGEAAVTGGSAVFRETARGPVLAVEGDTQSSVAYALKVLGDSPLSARLRVLPALRASGSAAATIALTMPFRRIPEGIDYRVDADIRDGGLVVPGSDLEITEISGKLRVDRDSGLSSKALAGRFLGGQITASVVSAEDTARVDIVTNPEVDVLARRYPDVGKFINGQTEVNGTLYLPYGSGAEGSARLEVNSALEGLEITLPGSLGKPGGEAAGLEASLDFSDQDNVLLRGTVGDRGALALSFKGGAFRRGEIHLGDGEATLPEAQALLVNGRLDSFNWQQWQPLLAGGSGGGAAAFAGLEPRVDFAFGQFIYSDFELGATRVKGGYRRDGGWIIDIEAARLGGQVRLPGEERRVTEVDLDYLKLPEHLKKVVGRGAEENNSTLEGADPARIPAFKLTVGNLFLGDERLGNIGLTSHPVENGVLFSDLAGDIRGIQVRAQPLGEQGDGGEDDSSEDGATEVPAELRWTAINGEHTTFFSGTLAVDDVENALAKWGYPPPFSGETATFYSELGWSGRPWEVSLLGLDGYLGFELRDGQFYRAAGPATNTLFKLVSLVNFDTWLRRLRFDFSDLFSGGVSFDKVTGGLLFRQGIVDFDDPIVAVMPSGKLRLSGSADLTYEQMDARLVATLPVGTNLPWVAGLLGGLPAAAGIYLSSKIFEKQVDQLSSLSYTVKGSLDDPDIEVDRIFTDPSDIEADNPDQGEKTEEQP